jgi:hypothetical protein
VPDYRVTFEFAGPGGSAFNEVYYTTDSAIAGALPSTGLVNARLALLHPQYTLQRVRIAQADALRVTLPKTLNLPGVSDGSGGPLPPGDAVVSTLTSAAGGSRKIWLRGCPASYQLKDSTSGRDSPPASLITRLQSWFLALNRNGYGIRQVSKQAPGPLKNVKINSVDGSRKDGTSDLTLAVAPGYPFPSRVIIGGASKKDLPYLNGRWSLVKVVAGAVITIPYQTPGGLVISGGNAQVRQEVYPGVNVFDSNLSNFAYYGVHITKNTSTRSRGARRAARLRASL